MGKKKIIIKMAKTQIGQTSKLADFKMAKTQKWANPRIAKTQIGQTPKISNTQNPKMDKPQELRQFLDVLVVISD